ncbi:MAG: hypothetical protein ACREKM_04315 [Longimicrobiales bacterium]
MRVPMVLPAAAVLAVLSLVPVATSAQRLEQPSDWRRATPAVADTARIYSLPLPGQPAELGRMALPVSDQQLQRHASPTPFIIGGTAVGLFAGGVIGYATCVAADGDCSALMRMAAGTAIGSFIGAVLWLGIAPQP